MCGHPLHPSPAPFILHRLCPHGALTSLLLPHPSQHAPPSLQEWTLLGPPRHGVTSSSFCARCSLCTRPQGLSPVTHVRICCLLRWRSFSPPPNAPARSLGEGVPLTPVASWKLTRSEQNGEPIVQPQHRVGEATKDVSSSETKESMTARQEVSCGVCSAPASACRCH